MKQIVFDIAIGAAIVPGMAVLAAEFYKRGVKKGIDLAVDNFLNLHATYDILMSNGQGTIEVHFVKPKREVK